MPNIQEITSSKDYTSPFGGCPKCGGTDGCTNVVQSHWCYCQEHKTKWWIGADLFSSWRHETEEQQRAAYNKIGLGEFEEVKPIPVTDGRASPLVDRSTFSSHDAWFAAVLAKNAEPKKQRSRQELDRRRCEFNDHSSDVDPEDLPF